MNKRTAITLAGGVTGALVSGVAGYSLSLNQAVADNAPAKPIVRTEIRTVTIHRKAKPKAHPTQAAPTTVVVRAAPSGSIHQAPPVHHTGGSAHHGDDGGGDGGDD
jgi:hypothetical protein